MAEGLFADVRRRARGNWAFTRVLTPLLRKTGPHLFPPLVCFPQEDGIDRGSVAHDVLVPVFVIDVIRLDCAHLIRNVSLSIRHFSGCDIGSTLVAGACVLVDREDGAFRANFPRSRGRGGNVAIIIRTIDPHQPPPIAADCLRKVAYPFNASDSQMDPETSTRIPESARMKAQDLFQDNWC